MSHLDRDAPQKEPSATVQQQNRPDIALSLSL
ncbi:hypothetical protein AJ78_09051 [Emergomyces pasteurianus Ep9510]|uniref:Uncharacterized protein n=1 Tax=Emergomyces pasteurianus Ep9510 TaxID=1447872 RepID=A0A1J9NZF4_9EURO|nr:hypothetical protein AJ78_09051 [Emergomyces pasteurianus Ep9510]